MATINLQKDEFQDRLARIRKGGPNTAGTIHIGPVDEDVLLGRKRVRFEGFGTGGLLLFPFAVVWAVIFGMLAVFAARYVRLELDGSALYGVATSNTLMLVDFSIAMFIAFCLRHSFRVRSRVQMAILFVGIGLGLTGMHNMAYLFPEQMGAIYTQAWVSEGMAAGPVGSLVYHGEVLYALN